MEIVVLGINKNYMPILIDLKSVSEEFSKMHGNLNPSKLIGGLTKTPSISAYKCRSYGATIPMHISGKTNQIQTDIVDFFVKVREYADSAEADYALIQGFNFEIGRSTKNVSALVQLLLEEKL